MNPRREHAQMLRAIADEIDAMEDVREAEAGKRRIIEPVSQEPSVRTTFHLSSEISLEAVRKDIRRALSNGGGPVGIIRPNQPLIILTKLSDMDKL